MAVVEIARMTTTATEVQVAADSAALAGALAVSQLNPGQAQTYGGNVAKANAADGHAVDNQAAVSPADVQIDTGTFDAAANPHFTKSDNCTSSGNCNAAKATVTIHNVQYLVATILGTQGPTDVTKNAVAFAPCQASGTPLPLAVCASALGPPPSGGAICGNLSQSFTMQPEANPPQNACWTSLSQTGANAIRGLLPAACGGTPQQTVLQQSINLQNGVAVSVYQALQCCVQCKNVHEFVIPVVDCGAIGTCTTSPPVLGFATLKIVDARDIRPSNGPNNCNNDYPGCGSVVNVDNICTGGASNGLPCTGASQCPGGTCTPLTDKAIVANQVCNTDLSGRAGITGCSQFSNTVMPVLGQLP